MYLIWANAKTFDINFKIHVCLKSLKTVKTYVFKRCIDANEKSCPILKSTKIILQIVFYYCLIPDIGMMVRVFTNGPGDEGSIPGQVIPKTQKMVLDAPLLNTQQYKVGIKG